MFTFFNEIPAGIFIKKCSFVSDCILIVVQVGIIVIWHDDSLSILLVIERSADIFIKDAL